MGGRKKTLEEKKIARAKTNAKVFRQEVKVWDEGIIFEKWAKALSAKKYRLGVYRKVVMPGAVANIKQIRADQKKVGYLWIINKTQFNLYMEDDKKFNINVVEQLIESHPLVAEGSADHDVTKPLLTDKEEEHASEYNIGFRTNFNETVLAGWSKHRDPLGIHHLWMLIQTGPKTEERCQMVINMLCEIAGCQLPYHDTFFGEYDDLAALGAESGTEYYDAEDLEESEEAMQTPRPLATATEGNSSSSCQSAVGGSEVPGAAALVAVGRSPSSSSQLPPQQQQQQQQQPENQRAQQLLEEQKQQQQSKQKQRMQQLESRWWAGRREDQQSQEMQQKKVQELRRQQQELSEQQERQKQQLQRHQEQLAEQQEQEQLRRQQQQQQQIQDQQKQQQQRLQEQQEKQRQQARQLEEQQKLDQQKLQQEQQQQILEQQKQQQRQQQLQEQQEQEQRQRRQQLLAEQARQQQQLQQEQQQLAEKQRRQQQQQQQMQEQEEQQQRQLQEQQKQQQQQLREQQEQEQLWQQQQQQNLEQQKQQQQQQQLQEEQKQRQLLEQEAKHLEELYLQARSEQWALHQLELQEQLRQQQQLNEEEQRLAQELEQRQREEQQERQWQMEQETQKLIEEQHQEHQELLMQYPFQDQQQQQLFEQQQEQQNLQEPQTQQQLEQQQQQEQEEQQHRGQAGKAQPESEEQRTARLLSLRRRDPRQVPRSKRPVNRFEVPCNPLSAASRITWSLDWKIMDKLFDAVLINYWQFTVDMLARPFAKEHPQRQTKPQNYVAFMNDNNIHYRHKLFDEVISKGLAVRGGPWRLFEALPAIDEPTQVMTQQDFQKEFGFAEEEGPHGAIKRYFTDIVRRYEGEVAEIEGGWVIQDTPMPRKEAMWHHQFARGEAQRQALKDLQTQSAVGDKEFEDNVDVHELGSTTVLRFPRDGVGHWRRQAKVTVLARLFYDLGKEYTAQELLWWWLHAYKIVKKREHSTVPDRQAAAQIRKKKFGHYGFSRYD